MSDTIEEVRDAAGGAAPPERPGRRRWWLVAAVIALVAAVVVTDRGPGDPPPEDGVPAPAGSSDGTEGAAPGFTPSGSEVEEVVGRSAAWRELGFFAQPIADDGVAQFVALERWLGREVPYFISFGDGRSVGSFQRNLTGKLSDEHLGRWGDQPPFRLVHTMPMAFGDRSTDGRKASRGIEAQWDALIAGDDDQRQIYVDAAEQLVEAGYGDAIIRLGHEFDGPVSRWYAGVDVEKFKAAWRVIHGVFRDVSPEFVFDYNFMRFNAESPIIEQAYPGDDYVDIIGMDIYDQGWDGTGRVPPGQVAGWSDPEAVWREYHQPKLEVHRAFAEHHGKPMSFPEWGLGGGGGEQRGRAGGDNPLFIQRMHDWMSDMDETGPGLAYHGYFQGNPGHDGPHELVAFPQSELRFRELFGR